MVLFTGEEATLSLQSDAFFMLNNDINLIFRMVRNRKLYIICHLKKYNYRGIIFCQSKTRTPNLPS